MFESMRSKMVSARDDSAENYRGKRGAVQREDARECYSFCFGQKNLRGNKRRRIKSRKVSVSFLRPIVEGALCAHLYSRCQGECRSAAIIGVSF